MKTPGKAGAGIVLLALLAVACKKDYNCECTVTTNDPYRNENVVTVVSRNVYSNRLNAVSACERKAYELDTLSYTYVNCKLK